jgi:hypothetical protein
MATPRLETKTVPLTVTYLVEDTIRTTRTSQVTTRNWFMTEARAAVNQNTMLITAEDQNRGSVI